MADDEQPVLERQDTRSMGFMTLVKSKVQALLCEAFGSAIFGTLYMVTLFNGDSATLSFSSVALGIGSAYMCMVFIGLNVSGGHYNPAVTLGMLISQLSFQDGVLGFCKDFCSSSVVTVVYAGAQVGGYLVATILARLIVGKDMFKPVLGGSICQEPTDGDEDGCSRVVAVEMLVSFIVVVVFIAANSTKGGQKSFVNSFDKPEAGAAALTIGFATIAAMSMAGSISRAVLNPGLAVGLWFGQDTMHEGADKLNFLVLVYYLMAQVIGGFLAGLFAITGIFSRDN